MGEIYLVTNIVNGTQYVGKTVQTAKARWAVHTHLAAKNSQTPLHRAIRKYGKAAFRVDLLKQFTREDQDERGLNEWEKFFIDALRRCGRLYNVTDGGDGVSGLVHSAETRKRLSDLMTPERRRQTALLNIARLTGTKASLETRKRMSRAKKGRISQNQVEQCRQLGLASVGRKLSLEARKHLSEIQRDVPRKTHCKRGHERGSENITARGQCKLCKIDYEREYNRRRKKR